MENKFYVKEFAPDKFHIINRLSGLPAYDDDGESPSVFTEDQAILICDIWNTTGE